MSELSQEAINNEVAKLVEGLEVDEKIIDKIMSDVKELINKVQYPDNYCPKCAERMFFKNGAFCCPLHGKQDIIMTIIPASKPQPSDSPEPEFTRRPIRNPKRASTIRDLANKLGDSGAIRPTPVDPKDGSPLPGATSKEINWV